jgi:DNA gyrase subunit A
MLVTDAGRLIRVPADQIRQTGRQAMGVTLFRLDAGERVTSVFPVLDDTPDDAPEAVEIDDVPPTGETPDEETGEDTDG